MIQPGQKLKEGDICIKLTREQAKELLDISKCKYRKEYPDIIEQFGIIYFSQELYAIEREDRNLTQYNFADFKKLCENTFGDGSV